VSGFPFTVEPLAGHDRSRFFSGVDALDRYFQVQVSQDIRRRVTACYVAVEAATGAVAGFYTLSASDIPLTDIPAELAKKLPRYPAVPAARVGRLAVDQRFRGKKLGAALLFNAVMRAARSEVAVFALVVDAKDAAAEAFYRHHGFQSFGSIPRQLIAAIDTCRGMLD
jgi:ribosomal protein S18 acetylase RimI-like enzyme